MVAERKKGWVEKASYFLKRWGAESKAKTFYNYFGPKLGLEEGEALAFRSYFAAYFIKSEGLKAPSYIVDTLESPANLVRRRNPLINKFYGLLEEIENAHDSVISDLLMEAGQHSNASNISPDRWLSIEGGARVLAETYQSALRFSRDERIDIVNRRIISLHLLRFNK